MNAEELRACQAPLKERYKERPGDALITLRATGRIEPGRQACVIVSEHGPTTVAGLHPAAGGSGADACSGDMFLQALIACAGVTLATVATALGIPVRGGTATAEGDIDFRGTLGVSREVPIGFTAIRLKFDLDTDASDEQLAKLLQLTERFCVNFQTLRTPPSLSASCVRAGAV